jgi:integrase
MARTVKDANLQSREARERLKVSGKPYYRTIEEGLHLGYRKPKSGAGKWVLRHYVGNQAYRVEVIGAADDFSDADGIAVLNWKQAQQKARERMVSWAHTAAGKTDPLTVAKALERYEADLETRGGDVNNVKRLRVHLSGELGGKFVCEVTSADLKPWRDKLRKKQAAGSVNRTANTFRAALNYAADHDSSIKNREAWRVGLKALPDADESRNVILPESKVLCVVAEAYRESDKFGLLIDVAAVTGARYSQLTRIEVQDLPADGAPRILMPSSKKGKSLKKITRRPVSITADLAARLRKAAGDRAAPLPLLVKTSGEPWKKSDQTRLFRKVAARAGLDPDEVTMYALRHTSIVRQLRANVPIRVVAVHHDTSVQMIEKTYSRHIGDYVDDLTRPTLLDTASINQPVAT